LRRCFLLRQNKHPIIRQCAALGGDILLVELASDQESFVFAANLGFTLQHVPSDGIAAEMNVRNFPKRLIHNGQTDVVLQPGEYEVFAKS
jgi:hypothetical protein